jgi:hypothetical protein
MTFKLLMYLLFIWGGTYGFGWGEIHNEGRLKGWALKVDTFLGPEMAAQRPMVGRFWGSLPFGSGIAPLQI